MANLEHKHSVLKITFEAGVGENGKLKTKSKTYRFNNYEQKKEQDSHFYWNHQKGSKLWRINEESSVYRALS